MDVFGLGPVEVLVILIIALIVFGPGKLPEIGAGIGRAVREFRKATTELTRDITRDITEARAAPPKSDQAKIASSNDDSEKSPGDITKT
ncbi:MAG: twin-arginine translocase TatA/TatE family subunit [Chloroflexi bacterium]|nr:twin-arginine translocase TatA/TatE family subunit [Chloroflexota bacterium]